MSSGLVSICVDQDKVKNKSALQVLYCRCVTDALTDVTVSTSKSNMTSALIWIDAVATNLCYVGEILIYCT